MLIRKCAGGVIFRGEDVFLLKNDKGEWILPKGVIRGNVPSQSVALERVKAETGVDARIMEAVGETNYEFYSTTRRQPVNNRVMWYVMGTDSPSFRIAFEQGFVDGGWYPVEDALQMITYTQDRSLVRIAYERFQELTALEA